MAGVQVKGQERREPSLDAARESARSDERSKSGSRRKKKKSRSGGGAGGKPRSLLNQVLEFASEVGLPMTLADIGLGELSSEMLDRIAARTTAKGETIHNEPFEVHPEMVVDSIRAADAAGRAWRSRHGRNGGDAQRDK